MSVLVRQIVLRNYKSIAQCKVACGDLTVLIGPNGVGKSNFVDALRFVSESLTNTLEFAIRQRGGIGEVRRRSGGHPNHFAISLRLQLTPAANAHFAFQIGARPEGAFTVQHEQAGISCAALDAAFYEVREGSLVRASEHLKSAPKALEDRLFLTAVSGVEAFRPLFDALAGMGFYSINPDPIREIHPHDRGELLDRSGRNLAAVIKRLSEEKPHVVARIEEYLRQIVPGIEAVDHVSFGPRETLGFRQTVQRNRPPWRFYASSMSDGTLRSLGVLTALFQFSANSDKIIPFIAIEEPESTIHPGGANIIMDAILEASRTQQILVTTHSTDLLDHVALINSNILGVQKIANDTVIGPVNEASMSAIRDGLYTPGELLRQGQLPPDPKKTAGNLRQSDLFEAM